MLESTADEGQDNAAHLTTTTEMQESVADDQHVVAAHCTTTPQRLESISNDGQGNTANCTSTPERPESLATHGQGNATQCTKTVRMQVNAIAVGMTQEAMQSGHAAEATKSLSGTQQESHRSTSFLNFPPGLTAPPFPRQFWKAGEYRLAARAAIDGGQNRLRIHPKFLHSNATSHKWAFGAIAELLDNAVDEIHNGATFVKIDKIKHAPDREYSLMIQDDGGGMSPESLRSCMSFGFSHKCSTSIGQYGNGFKTSTMRLGADVIVFTCRQDNDNRRLTRSVGLLSYTFLMSTRCNDILVPAVDYESDASSSTFKRIMNYGEKHFFSNLSALLKCSPFSTEDELLNQFRGMESHGTKIIVFNLWFKDEREMELDFRTDEEDIMISGAPPIRARPGTIQLLKQMHVANRCRYSLRVYSSILYLHLPENFRIILCGRAVEPHRIAHDLIYRECIKYRPQVNEITEVDVITTIGFLKGAPRLDIYGFSVYHKNRLILPFWPAGSYNMKRRGIAGVLETNFIRPTHDKQDFEKTGLFHKLETRLKDMAVETHHCQLVGYAPATKRVAPPYYVSTADNNDDSLASQAAANIYSYDTRARASVALHPCSNGDNSQDPLHVGALADQMDADACPLTSMHVRTTLHVPRSAPQQSQTELCKRRNPEMTYWRAQKRQKNHASQPGSEDIAEVDEEESKVIVAQNTRLKAQCSELEAAAPHLVSKVEELRKELDIWRHVYQSLIDDLRSCDREEEWRRSLRHYHSSLSHYGSGL
ncbi:hypothetical protein EJB05_44799 [Eragrostis curvula]|uniref:Morc S5 domain-containing protein n=1 Tax=Eragrostis curvula TaxID=38414 RepID=A0A5J9TIH6_9POAL|nr:hypothetical protein EJB05_44799 [Eragrostis curvula]